MLELGFDSFPLLVSLDLTLTRLQLVDLMRLVPALTLLQKHLAPRTAQLLLRQPQRHLRLHRQLQQLPLRPCAILLALGLLRRVAIPRHTRHVRLTAVRSWRHEAYALVAA